MMEAWERLRTYGGQVSLRPLAELVSAFAGKRIDVRWGDGVNTMQLGQLGHWDPTLNEIRLHWLLGQNVDARLAEVFWHEAAHALLPKRDKTPEQREREAMAFAEGMLARLGPDFIWDLVTMLEDLDQSEEERALSEVRSIANAYRTTQAQYQLGRL